VRVPFLDHAFTGLLQRFQAFVHGYSGDLSAKNGDSGDQQREKQRHQQRRNKPLSKIEARGAGHVKPPSLVEAGAQTLSVTDNSPGRAVMAKTVTVTSSDSEANRVSV
jgi:hypothetical protein